MALRLPRQLTSYSGKRINRAPSPVLAVGVPWLTVMLASLVPLSPVIASAPVLPPIGFILLLAWRQVRPGLLPVWAGLPLGAFDDQFSGQPFGSGILLWSLAMIVSDLVDMRFPWRNFALEWLVAASLIAASLALGVVFANATGAAATIELILPQLAISILLFPLACRLVARFDRFRLLPFREID